MANPAVVTVSTGAAWTKVATNVSKGIIHKLSNNPAGYLQTYRLTGEATPSDFTDAVKAFLENDYEEISASANIDVYMYAQNVAGSVRVDV